MFILFIPIPYVDASSSYHFVSKWQRIAVSIAGIMTELLLGSIAIYLWVTTEAGIYPRLCLQCDFHCSSFNCTRQWQPAYAL